MDNETSLFVPVTRAERVVLLDVLRGIAIFGILPVNMLFFSAPLGYLADPPWTSFADRAASTIINFFFSAKFYPLFSLLFGIGFAIQCDRAKDRPARFTTFWWRRMIVLVAIGYAHIALVWYGDILHLYAILGVALLVFRDHAAEDLPRPAGISLAIPIVLIWFVTSLAHAVPEAMPPNTPWTDEARMAEAISGYRSGNPSDIAVERWRDYANLAGQSFVFLPIVFGMFLLGVWAWRSELIRRVSERTEWLKKIVRRGLLIGLPLNVVWVVGTWYADPTRVSPLTAMVATSRFIAGISMSLVYASGIALMARRPPWERVFRLFAPVGRMALSNYLLQSIVCTTVFYGYGFGLYGSTGPAFGLALAVVLLAVQIPLSALWLRRFRFGPAEWAWRRMSYGSSVPRDRTGG